MDGKFGTVPYYVLEEHHEAFYLWGLAAQKGILSSQNNVLFHVDHHDDLVCGAYFRDFTRPFSSLEERRAFTYERLGIADFIVPALYEGLFSTLYNLKSVLPTPFVHRDKLVHLIGNNCLKLMDEVPFLHASKRAEGDPAYRFFSYWEGGLSETPPLQSVVLDIDLDYFCWDDSLHTAFPKQIELTADAYKAFCQDPYHPLRILPRQLFQAVECDGRYYLRYEEASCPPPSCDEARIKKRVARFLQWLTEQPWTPCLVTLCRSAHSGYLPRDRADLVEKLVTQGLDDLWH
ncbi:hypothetical protein Ruko_12300 [Ruthenibacterium sp. TH_2024_36131]|uniref:UPF0489 family protein n=1 Tax=Owariibacterium komagatae TaxID=3136601 RepID=UPI0038B2BCDB